MADRGVDFTCAKCRKPITEYDAQITPDGKLYIFGYCHGDEFERVLWLGIGGEVFGPDPEPEPLPISAVQSGEA